MSSPIAPLIKHHSDNVHLTWVIESRYARLLSDHPDIDKVITWDKTYWLRLLRSGRFIELFKCFRLFRKELKSREYSLALDLQGLFISSFIAWLSGAHIRIALGASQLSHWFVTKTISRNIGEETQLGSEYRYLLAQLGMPDSPWEMYVAPPRKTSKQIEQMTGFSYTTEKYAVFCPFSVYASKRWPDAYWKQIALRIRGRYNLRAVILGQDRDASDGEAIAAATGTRSLAGHTTLNDAAEIIKHAKLVIGVDNGLTHMAHAFRIPTIALFGSTCPYSYAGVETSKIIYHKRFCSPCNNKSICHKRFDCMQEIEPDQVLSELKPLMKIAQENEQVLDIHIP